MPHKRVPEGGGLCHICKVTGWCHINNSERRWLVPCRQVPEGGACAMSLVPGGGEWVVPIQVALGLVLVCVCVCYCYFEFRPSFRYVQ